MRKEFFIVLHFILFGSSVFSQINIQPVVPATGLIQRSQLWNVLIMNSDPTLNDCSLNVVLTNRSTGQPVLSAVTTPFSLQQGARQFNINTFNPVQYNYLSGRVNGAPGELLPMGAYTACYYLSTTSGKGNNLAEACVDFDVEPLSPPLLIYPADSSQLQLDPKQFSWTAPSPRAMFSQLHYQILITEIIEGQNGNAAIQENIPFYNENLLGNSTNLPGTLQGFKRGKWYAWQVVARDEGEYAGKSDVHVFSVQPDSSGVTLSPDVYLLLQDSKKGTYQLNNRKLNIKYFSFEKKYSGKMMISDVQGNEIKSDKLTIRQGQNYFQFHLGSRFKVNTLYTVTIVDTHHHSHSLSFRLLK